MTSNGSADRTPREGATWRPVWALSVTSLISWGTLYYAFSVLLLPIGHEQGWGPGQMTGAFSASLLVSGLATYPVGYLIGRFGGRAVMAAGSLLAALSLGLVGLSATLPAFYVGWVLAGLAMAATLYEAAFSALAGAQATDYRRAVTTVTLAGGLASTVFWPLTERLVAWFGWREALGVYVLLHLGVCVPLHLLGLPARRPRPSPTGARSSLSFLALMRQPKLALLAASFTLSGVVVSIVSVHLVPMLQTRGMSPQQAAWMASVAGPMQVTGRALELMTGDRWRASQTGTLALGVLAVAVATFVITPAPVALVLLGVGLYGISNGVLTIVRSLSVIELFGREQYPRVSGALLGPAIVARAVGPYLASLILSMAGSYQMVIAVTLLFAIGALGLFVRAVGRE